LKTSSSGEGNKVSGKVKKEVNKKSKKYKLLYIFAKVLSDPIFIYKETGVKKY